MSLTFSNDRQKICIKSNTKYIDVGTNMSVAVCSVSAFRPGPRMLASKDRLKKYTIGKQHHGSEASGSTRPYLMQGLMK